MNVKERIGYKIAFYRKKLGLKQAELAELVSISAKHQSRIENGVNFPSAELLENYVKIFKIDVADLLDIRRIEENIDIDKEIQNLLSIAEDRQKKLIYEIIKPIILG